VIEKKEKLAHPTRFERVTFAFGGRVSRPVTRYKAVFQAGCRPVFRSVSLASVSGERRYLCLVLQESDLQEELNFGL
jgi:hypothetical protein